MQLNEVSFDGALPIDGYGPGFFRIAGERREGAILVAAGRATPWGGLSDPAPLVAAADQIDVLFMGMGAEIAHLPAPLAQELSAAGIAWEVMASPAAARCYNVLLSEGRRVAAALLPV